MRYTEEQKKYYLNTITELRAMNYTWEQIEDEFKERFGIKKIQWLRKNWELLNKHLDLEVKMDEDTVNHRIAKKMAIMRTQQKVLTKERNLLNYDANVVAYRKLISSILSTFKWNQYQSITPARKVSKKCLKTLNRAVYIIGDEHFKGKCDIDHLTTLYNKLQLDILCEGHEEVEIWYLGDGIDGLIHTGSLSSNDGTILPAIDYINILIERVNRIPEVKSVKFVAQSNHTQTRPLGTSRNELAREDINYLLIEIMKRGLRKDIELVADDIIRFNYDNFNIAMLHGHQPYATNKNKLIEYWSAKYHEVPDIILMGHFHQFKISEYGLNKWLVVCPTAKNFNGDYENVNGFISYSQITKMTIKDNIPVFQIIGIRKD